MNPEEITPNAQLTDEQIEQISTTIDEEIKGTDLEELANYPSSQGKLDRTDEERAETPGELKKIRAEVNPETGEIVATKIDDLGEDEHVETEEEILESIDKMVSELDAEDFKVDDETPITEEEIKKGAESEAAALLQDIDKEKSFPNLSNEAIKQLLVVANRSMKKEDFSVYNELPDEIKKMINDYVIKEMHVTILSKQYKEVRNVVAESLVNEFVTNIVTDRAMHDFNKELEDLFSKTVEDITGTIVGYTTERNAKYREYAETLEDEEKKAKLLEILDAIDSAYDLNTLAEFAKTCKIKNSDIAEPAKRAYNSFHYKYENVAYNIYGIDVAKAALLRNFAQKAKTDDSYTYLASIKLIDAFLICFCKYCINFRPENTLEHAYMYYVLFNSVLVDINKGEGAKVSDGFLDNVKKVIDNLIARNPRLVEEN